MALKAVTLRLYGNTYQLTKDSSGNYVKTITAPPVTSWGETDHAFPMVLQATDAAGNVTSIDKNHATFGSKMKLRVKEDVAPTITVISPSPDAYLTGNTVSFTIDVTDTGSGVAANTITAKLDGTALTLTKTVITAGFRCIYSGTVADGKHTLVVTATDNDGNAATAKTVTFTVDTVPPTLNITSPSPDLITNVQSCAVRGVTNDATSSPVTLKITLDGTDQGTITLAADGTFSKTVTLTKGDNIISITAMDRAGKVTTVKRTVTYDPDAPVIVSIDLSANPVGAGDTFTITVKATD